MPIEGARLTSPLVPRWGTLHAGVDLTAPMLTPEYAAMDGIVLQAGPASGFGQVVYMQHQNGDVTVYGHPEEILVRSGQTVRAGETIALVGNRGQSTGSHLHFEVRRAASRANRWTPCHISVNEASTSDFCLGGPVENPREPTRAMRSPLPTT